MMVGQVSPELFMYGNSFLFILLLCGTVFLKKERTFLSGCMVVPLAVDCKARIKEGNECSIAEKRDNLARVMAGGAMGGAQIILAKENTKWSIVYQGNGDVPQETVNKYKIPESWLGPSV
jgi:hypothetical protein